MTVHVLGGGPAGLAIAHGLTQESDTRFVVIERGSNVGGLAQTLRWGEHGLHDLGPHKLFTLDKALMARVEALLPPTGWLTRPKRSSIFMRGHFLPYPPSPFSLVKVYGPIAFGQMVFDYGRTRIQSRRAAEPAGTFEEDLVARVGRALYEALFRPIALKLWGDPAELDVKLSRGRVQTPRLSEVIGRLLKIRATSDFEALEFRYPRGGLQRMWDGLVAATQHQGVYHLNQEVTAIVAEDNTISAIRCRERATGAERTIGIEPEDFVFSTLPIGKLGGLLGGAIGEGTAGLLKNALRLNDLLLVFLKVDRPSLLEESWVFVPDPQIIFHRVSEQESFDPDMTPGGSIVCCEIMSSEVRPLSQCSDEELIGAARAGLATMGYRGFSVIDQRVIRLPASYPIFRAGFEPALREVLGALDMFSNFRTVGRQGAFSYIGTLDVMDIGYGVAQWFIKRGASGGKDEWMAERERTSHYPVLD